MTPREADNDLPSRFSLGHFTPLPTTSALRCAVWLVIEILLVLFLWFLRASGITPDLSWVWVWSPLWIPWVLALAFAAVFSGGSKSKRGRSKTRRRPGSRSRKKSKSWRSVGNIF